MADAYQLGRVYMGNHGHLADNMNQEVMKISGGYFVGAAKSTIILHFIPKHRIKKQTAYRARVDQIQ